jgi:hypothetical protein
MKILDNIYFCLVSIFLACLAVMIYYYFFYHPDRIISNDIKKNEYKYEELVKTITSKANQLPKDRLIAFKELPLEIQEKFSEIKIFRQPNYVVIQTDTCEKIDISIMSGDWNLEYNGCGTHFGSEYVRSGFIESWEINKNWAVWVDHDPI